MKKFYDIFLKEIGGSTANNKLSPVTIFVPTNVSNGHAKCFWHEGAWYHSTNVEEQERYIFTKEELCKFISDTLRDFDDKYNYTPGMKLLAERKEYIQSLF